MTISNELQELLLEAIPDPDDMTAVLVQSIDYALDQYDGDSALVARELAHALNLMANDRDDE